MDTTQRDTDPERGIVCERDSAYRAIAELFDQVANAIPPRGSNYNNGGRAFGKYTLALIDKTIDKLQDNGISRS